MNKPTQSLLGIAIIAGLGYGACRTVGYVRNRYGPEQEKQEISQAVAAAPAATPAPAPTPVATPTLPPFPWEKVMTASATEYLQSKGKSSSDYNFVGVVYCGKCGDHFNTNAHLPTGTEALVSVQRQIDCENNNDCWLGTALVPKKLPAEAYK